MASNLYAKSLVKCSLPRNYSHPIPFDTKFLGGKLHQTTRARLFRKEFMQKFPPGGGRYACGGTKLH